MIIIREKCSKKSGGWGQEAIPPRRASVGVTAKGKPRGLKAVGVGLLVPRS